MDNNNQMPVTNTPPVQAPVAQADPPAVGSISGGKNNKMLWIIGIVVAVIIVLGVAAYMFMGKGGPTTNQQGGINVTDLQSEADSIQDEDLDSDFKALDSDLQNL